MIKKIVSNPTLNDKKGDLSQRWYVEFSYRADEYSLPTRKRVFAGLNLPTKKERYAQAEIIIAEAASYLKHQTFLKKLSKREYYDTLDYFNKQGVKIAPMHSVKRRMAEYLSEISYCVQKKTLQDYSSKLRHFGIWLDGEKLSKIEVKKIDRNHIKDFAIAMAKRGLSRKTVKEYILAVHAYFGWEITNKSIKENPASHIQSYGKIVDCAANPISKKEMTLLKKYLEKNLPQIFLASEFIYYCALRPGSELRLMKVGDIDFDNKVLRVSCITAKNKKTETIRIPEHLIDKMKELGYDTYNKDYYVFGKTGQPYVKTWGMNTMRMKFNIARDELGLSKSIKFYSWKHTGIITALHNGMHPFDVQHHCRHQSFTTTEKYIQKMTKIPKDNSVFFDMI
jgi:integrase